MNFGILGIIGLVGLGVSGVITAMDVAEQRRLEEQQLSTPAVEVQQVQPTEEGKGELGW